MIKEQIVPPLFNIPEGIARWETAEAARLIADARLSVETAQSQIRRFAQKGWIYAAGQRRTGPTAANLFNPTAVASAKVLSVLTALGTDDMESAAAGLSGMGYAALGLSAWADEQPMLKGFGSPVMAAMAGAVRGEWWVYQLNLLCGDQTGQLQRRAWVYDPDASWRPPSEGHTPEMMPLAAVTIHLRPLLLPLYTRMTEAIGGSLPAQAN